MFSGMTQAQFYALIKKLNPYWWTEGLENHAGDGITQAYSLVGGRVSTAIHNLYTGLVACTADYGTYATGTVALARHGNAGGTLPAGTILEDFNGELVFTSADVTFTYADWGPHNVSVTSLKRSFQANLLAGTILGVNTTGDGQQLWDISLYATVVSDMTGGHSPDLESCGQSKGMEHGTGESEISFRHRLRTFADIVTPAAILRTVQKYVPSAVMLSSYTDTGYGLLEGFNMAGPAPDVDFYTDYAGPEGPPMQWTFQNFFVVRIPAQVMSLQDLTWLFADYGHTDYQDGFAATTMLALDSTGLQTYNVGGYSSLNSTILMSQDVELARPAGVLWYIEEV